MMQAQRAEGKEPTGEIAVTLFVRAEAAGVVIGKQGWVLGRVRHVAGKRRADGHGMGWDGMDFFRNHFEWSMGPEIIGYDYGLWWLLNEW